jgi:hypothetical protein
MLKSVPNQKVMTYSLSYRVKHKNLLLSFQVIIEATVGDGSRGDIAIDDVSFTPQCVASSIDLPVIPTLIPTNQPTQVPPCGPGEFMCNNGQCLPVSVRCDGNPDCSDTSNEINCGRL